jgi:hypothetical protein
LFIPSLQESFLPLKMVLVLVVVVVVGPAVELSQVLRNAKGWPMEQIADLACIPRCNTPAKQSCNSPTGDGTLANNASISVCQCPTISLTAKPYEKEKWHLDHQLDATLPHLYRSETFQPHDAIETETQTSWM